MQYMLLIYSDESQAPPPPSTDAQRAEMMAPWLAYNESLKAAGVMIAGDALLPTDTATTVSRVTGEMVVTDGPFAETKEQLGGYYLLECADLDAALKWAEACPGTAFGKVEVRPLMSLG